MLKLYITVAKNPLKTKKKTPNSQKKTRLQRFALLGAKVLSFKYLLGNFYVIILIINILSYCSCVFRKKKRRKFIKPAEFDGKTAGIGCSLGFSKSTHFGLSFDTTLNILSQSADFDGFGLLSYSNKYIRRQTYKPLH